MAKKYIIVTGGVLSGIGKGVVSASIGRLLKELGLTVNSLKIDPYLNVDAGTMNPNQHGEVFVTEDGYEADLDLGHYERFLGIEMKSFNNMTAGQVYKYVIEKEREGKYLGATVQMVPHVTERVKERIEEIDTEVLLIEIGGTVGDIEGEIFLEAVRELSFEKGRENFMFIHVTFVPYLHVTNEFKTKPTQQSIQLLRRIGIQPDMLLVRTEKEIDLSSLEKVALFGGVPLDYVVNLPDLANIYEVPQILYEKNIHTLISSKLNLEISKEVEELSWKCPKTFKNLKIAMICKYLGTDDAYKSIMESVFLNGTKRPDLINSEELEEMSEEEIKILLSKYEGIIIPGGFGARGIEGKIKAIKYARENNVPLLGICLGMQLMVIEYARNVFGYKEANSTEFDENTPYPVIDLMEEQKKLLNLGGTMRLGAQNIEILPNTKLHKIYGEKNSIFERHRHRYEVNYKEFEDMFEKGKNVPNKLSISAVTDFVEAIELSSHPFYIGIQYHPEFKTKVGDPHPIFKAFIEAIEKNK
ncbi:CTP synthase [Petrotoga olearia]|uniref:CTP synthase n=2 Tax=Petrotoga olearia TaxID=156203 RepID=A0A2K1P0N4_9BACT|nr:CTP synthase [Petrotoga olearia]PNR96341.1 CTP synthetase [Petrotoga olearia DSM 13574]RMA76616.1 CTP synthase [Petrotoga olearia]